MTYSAEREIKDFFSEWWRIDLFELTYAYTIQNNRFFNRTLLSDYARCEMNDRWEKLITKTRIKLEEDIDYLWSLIEYLSKSTDRHAVFYVKTLMYTKGIYEMIWWSVPFEVQKRYIDDNYDEYKLEECLQKVHILDREIFGQLVSERSREVSRSEAFLQRIYLENSDKLSSKEMKNYLKYVHRLRELPHYKEEIGLMSMSSSCLDDQLFDTLIYRDDYIDLFALVFDFYHLKVSIKIDERNSIYDGHDAMYIPNNDKYAFLPLRKVLNLIAHEVETHYIVLHNTDKLLWWIKWSHNLAREEWLATMQEFLLTWKELSDIDMSSNMPMILLWEILSWKEYLEFLSLYRSLRWIQATWIDRLLRSKRGYPLRWIWVQHKDVAYSRWVYQVRTHLLNGGDFIDLFLGKVSFEDISLLITHKNEYNLIFPKQVTMRLVFALLSWWDEKRYKNFMQQSVNSYPFIEKLLLTPFTEYEQKIFVSLTDKISLLLRDRDMER